MMLWRIQLGPGNRRSKVVDFWSTIKVKQNKAKEPFYYENWPTEEMVDLTFSEPAIVVMVQEEVGQLKEAAVSASVWPLLCDHTALPLSLGAAPAPTNWEFREGKDSFLFISGPSRQWGSQGLLQK